MKLNAKELRTVAEEDVKEQLINIKRRPIYFILENIYDTYNVGGLFRLADAIGVSKMYLCGAIEIPPNHKIKKASIGTDKVVNWEYKKTAREAIVDLRSKTYDLRESDKILKSKVESKKSVQIIAVEQDQRAKDYRSIPMALPIALILGNETSGVTAETLKLCDQIAEIPMWGVNKSLNVIVAAAVVSYWFVRNT